VGTDPQPAGAATEDDLAGKAVSFCGQGIAAGKFKGHDSGSLLAAAMLGPSVRDDCRVDFA